MGVVLAAYDPRLDRRVALKLLRPGRRSGETEDTAHLRLQREAQVMARLAHPNVVTVYDVGEVDDRVYVAMEFVEGRTLRQWLEERPRSWREVVQMFLGAGRGLAAAHAAGVVHRDFKPDNVLVGADERARVTDFGLASTSSRELPAPLDAAQAGTQLEAADLRRPLTVDGALVGTPVYMAPEQHDGAAVDSQADQFAFCVALYEALYGERPFKSDGYMGLLVQVKEGLVRPPPRGATVPAWLRKVLIRGLRPRPEDRYPGMEALLRALAQDPSAARRRIGAAAIGVVAIGIVALPFVHQRMSAPAPCSQARERLAGVWDDGVRQRMERAFIAAVPGRGGQAAYRRVASRIDSYADRWTEMHTDACLATYQRREQSEKLLDARMACLERRRGMLAAMTDGLAAADRAVVDKSVTAVSELGSLRDCADAESLLAVVPPPPEPESARRVAEVGRKLDRIEATVRLRGFKESTVALAELVREADATGYAPLRARAHWLSAEGHYLDDVEKAERELVLMSRLAADGRDDKQLVRGLGRTAVIYQMRGRFEQAVETARAAELVARRAGDELAVGYGQLTAAASLQALARHEEAEALWSAAFATLERRLDGENQSAFYSPLLHMASNATMRGRHAQAQQLMDRARAIAIATFGADDPRAIQAAFRTALGAQEQGKFREARRRIEELLAVVLRTEPRDEILATRMQIDVALLEDYLGDRAKAVGRLERAAADAERLGNRGLEARALLYLGRIRTAQGRRGDARSMFVRARGLIDRLDSDTTLILRAQAHLAGLEGRASEGRTMLGEALALCAKSPSAIISSCGAIHVARADLEMRAGDCRAARPHLDRGQATLEKTLGADHPMMVNPLSVRGRCLLSERRPADAVPVLERTLALLETAEVGATIVGEPRWLLARALWESGGDRDRALNLAIRAERELAGGDEEIADDLRAVRAWLRERGRVTETAKTPRN